VSFQIACEDQAEVDRLWAALSHGGSEGRCGWLKDRWGLSWQIVPTRLFQLLSDPDPNRSRRAMEAMLTMGKLDIAALERAADGGEASPTPAGGWAWVIRPQEARHGEMAFRARAHRCGVPRPTHDGGLGAGAHKGCTRLAGVRPGQPRAAVRRGDPSGRQIVDGGAPARRPPP